VISSPLRSFEKHSASTYILDEPIQCRIPSVTLNCYETGFSGMLTSLFVLVELLVGICHSESLPTLSEGLPFSQLSYLEFLIGMRGTDL
jgi:hypothetical protein